MDAKMFGAFLAQVRRAQGLTQAELAEQLHVTDKAVSRWERGVGLPDINTLEPLADALGLYLFDEFAGDLEMDVGGEQGGAHFLERLGHVFLG